MFLFHAVVQMTLGGSERKVFENIVERAWSGLGVQPKNTIDREDEVLS